MPFRRKSDRKIVRLLDLDRAVMALAVRQLEPALAHFAWFGRVLQEQHRDTELLRLDDGVVGSSDQQENAHRSAPFAMSDDASTLR